MLRFFRFQFGPLRARLGLREGVVWTALGLEWGLCTLQQTRPARVVLIVQALENRSLKSLVLWTQ